MSLKLDQKPYYSRAWNTGIFDPELFLDKKLKVYQTLARVALPFLVVYQPAQRPISYGIGILNITQRYEKLQRVGLHPYDLLEIVQSTLEIGALWLGGMRSGLMVHTTIDLSQSISKIQDSSKRTLLLIGQAVSKALYLLSLVKKNSTQLHMASLIGEGCLNMYQAYLLGQEVHDLTASEKDKEAPLEKLLLFIASSALVGLRFYQVYQCRKMGRHLFAQPIKRENSDTVFYKETKGVKSKAKASSIGNYILYIGLGAFACQFRSSLVAWICYAKKMGDLVSGPSLEEMDENIRQQGIANEEYRKDLENRKRNAAHLEKTLQRLQNHQTQEGYLKRVQEAVQNKQRFESQMQQIEGELNEEKEYEVEEILEKLNYMKEECAKLLQQTDDLIQDFQNAGFGERNDVFEALHFAQRDFKKTLVEYQEKIQELSEQVGDEAVVEDIFPFSESEQDHPLSSMGSMRVYHGSSLALSHANRESSLDRVVNRVNDVAKRALLPRGESSYRDEIEMSVAKESLLGVCKQVETLANFIKLKLSHMLPPLLELCKRLNLQDGTLIRNAETSCELAQAALQLYTDLSLESQKKRRTILENVEKDLQQQIQNLNQGIVQHVICLCRIETKVEFLESAVPMLEKLKSPPVINGLIKALEDPDPVVRHHAIYVLKIFKDSSRPVLDGLVRSLKDKSEGVRIEACTALQEFKLFSTTTINVLTNVIRQDNEESVRSAAVNVLLTALQDNDKRIRQDVIYALGESKQSTPAVIDALVRVLNDQGSGTLVRQMAPLALGKLQASTSEVIAALLAALNNSNKYLRANAAYALGQLKASNSEVVDALKALLSKEHSSRVKIKVTEALKQLGASLSWRDLFNSYFTIKF